MLSDAETNTRFEAHIAPVRDALARLLAVSEDLRVSRGSRADAHSRAMADLAQEAKFAGGEPWGDQPVEMAQAHAQNPALRRDGLRLGSGAPQLLAAAELLAALFASGYSTPPRRWEWRRPTVPPGSDHGCGD